jgi:hypothetical protein
MGRELTVDEKLEAQFWLRAFLRAFFAHVEGVTFAMRRAALEMHEQGHVGLSTAEACLLAEQRFVSERGKIKVLNTWNPLLDNVYLAFQVYPRAFRSSYALNTSDNGWACFQRALKLRDSVTHPKQPADLSLSPDSIRDLAAAIGWFSNQVVGMFTACLDGLENEAT